MTEHPFGWLSLLPPVIAIVLSMLTRRVVASMLVAVFVGALILSDWNPLVATGEALNSHLLSKLFESSTLHIFLFTILMGMMVGIISRAGGMRGLVDVVTPMANTRKRGQFTTWLLGLLIFFDDYANTLLLGKTLRPLTDKLRISREKLAYMVDSTAAPVAGLALISTWVAGEIEFVQAGLDKLPLDEDTKAYNLFVASIPYRFYILWALLFVPIVALLGRDFGPMLRAERKALNSGLNDASQSNETTQVDDEDVPARWFNAVIPILVTVLAVVWLLFQSGGGLEPGKSLKDAFGEADSYSSLLWGSFAGVVAAIVLIAPQRIISLNALSRAAGKGASMMLPALAILWLAQTISTMTGSGSSEVTRADEIAWMQIAGSSNEEIAESLSDIPVATAIKTLTGKDALAYQLRLSRADAENSAESDQAWNDLVTEAKATEKYLEPYSIRGHLKEAGFDPNEIDFALKHASRDETVLKKADAEAETPETVTILLPSPHFEQRTSRLYTGDFLASRLSDVRESGGFIGENFGNLLPTMVFILSAIVAFSTGTSWGTMGIVMPLAIPLAWSQIAIGGETVSPDHPIMLCCIASVLAGAIFGDHCSPISDTTVLSSQASDCDHAAHVHTQLPYALLVAVISILFGTIPVGYGVSVWLSLPAGVIVMLAFLFVFGKRTSNSQENPSE